MIEEPELSRLNVSRGGKTRSLAQRSGVGVNLSDL
jgi:hypothetical protein